MIKLFNTMGRPLQYKTDNGAPFQSSSFEHFAKQFGFRHRKITPYWPRANATAETVMRKLSKVLKIAKIEGKLEAALGEFLAAYHDTPHTATGIAPNFLMFGRTGTSGLPAADRVEYLNLQDSHGKARKHHILYNERMKAQFYASMRAKECPIRKGDKVLFKRDITRKDISPWDPNPFIVDSKKGSMVTVSRRFPKQQCITRNSSCFRLYMGVEDKPGQETQVQATPIQATQVQSSQAPTAEELCYLTSLINPSTAQRRTKGRPLKDVSEQIARERAEQLQKKRAANPPIRASARLASKATTHTTTSLEEGGRCCVAVRNENV